jgi:glycine hydroxymethyltransferase
VSNAAITEYIEATAPDKIDAGMLGYLTNLTKTAEVAPEVARGIVAELADQRASLKLIASENYCSLATQLAMGNLLTDKYAEGVPHQRFYEGCGNVDDIEAFACEQACRLFGAEHAYVQPHSGADANMIAYWAILSARVEMPALAEMGQKSVMKLSDEDWNTLRNKLNNQRLLGMDYYSGGHLTHGYRPNSSAKMFESWNYAVNPETGLIDYEELEARTLELKPLILLAGYSAYPREINFRRMREIADKVGAVFMVDMAHFAGLVAGGVFTGDANPVEHAHVVTSTTHKTLRGPRGGIVLCKKEFADFVNKGCPLVIGGPLPHVMAAKAVSLAEANQPAFKEYAKKVVGNARTLAQALVDTGLTLATGGTDNHLMLIDAAKSCNLTGRQAAGALFECGITLNFNSLPFDPNGPLITSGLRLGTPATTTLGMGADEMKEIAAIIKRVLDGTGAGTIENGPNAGKPSKRLHVLDAKVREEARARTKALLDRYPVYPELDLELLQKHFG